MTGIHCSTYFETEDHGYLPDRLLEKVSRKLPAHEYIKLGSYLGICMSEMEHLKCERDVSAQTREMLMLWYKKREKAEWLQLRHALEQCGRYDVVDDSRRFMVTYDMVDNVVDKLEDRWKMEAFFSFLAPKLPRDWDDLALYLGLSMTEIATISRPVALHKRQKKPVYEVLKIWKYFQTSKPSNLVKVLESGFDRKDVAMYVEGLDCAVSTPIKVPDTQTFKVTLV